MNQEKPANIHTNFSRYLPFLIVLLGLVLRLIHAGGRSLRFEEGLIARIVREDILSIIVGSTQNTIPVLFNLLVHKSWANCRFHHRNFSLFSLLFSGAQALLSALLFFLHIGLFLSSGSRYEQSCPLVVNGSIQCISCVLSASRLAVCVR